MFKAVLVLVVLTLAYSQFLCTPCQMGAGIVKDYLTYPDRTLVEMMEKLCTKIPENYQNQCKAAVIGFGQQFLRLARETFREDPYVICQKVGACNSKITESDIRAKMAILLEKSKALYSATEKKQCNLDELREIFYWLPPSFKAEIISQLIGNILGQFPRLKYEVVEKLVNDMFDSRVPAERVCKDIDDILLPEARRRQECSQKCMELVDLSPERILKVIMQCQFDFTCYLNEVAKELQEVGRCTHECYMREPFAKKAIAL
jgi:hypothetical protein